MVRHICSLLFFLCLFTSATAHGDTQLPLLKLERTDLARPVPVNSGLLLEDPQGELDARQALQNLQSNGRLTEGTVHIGYSKSVWWFGLQLQAPANEQLHLIIDYPFIDDLEVWVLANDKVIAKIDSGTHLPFRERGEPYPQLMLDLPPLSAAPHTLLIRSQSTASTILPLALASADQGRLLIAHSWLRGGLLTGILLGLSLFYLIRFSTLREKRLAYFSLTTLCATAFNASQHGMVGLLADDWPELSVWLTNFPIAGMMIFSSLFLSNALELHSPRLRWLRDPLFVAAGLCTLAALIEESTTVYLMVNLLTLLFGCYQLFLLLLAVRLRRPNAMGYLVCWSAALLMAILMPLSRIGMAPMPVGFHELYSYLPALAMLMFGGLLDQQLERIRQALVTSQGQAIENLQQYQALFRNSGEGIFRCDRDGTLLEVNPSLERMLADDEKAPTLTGRSLNQLLGEDTWTQLRLQLDAHNGSLSSECQVYSLDGAAHWVYLSLHQRPRQGDIEGIVVDLSERRALEDRLQKLAAHDPLTGLLNRRELERMLCESLSDSATPPFSHLLCLGVDRFKQVNDLYGHSAGDQLLRQLSNQLSHHLPRHAVLARIGGDEFAVLLRESADHDAFEHAEKLRRSVEQFVFTWHNRPFRLNVSIGLLALDSGVCDWETALSWTTSASQLAKHQGRNRTHQVDPADGALLKHQRQLQWISRLREAIERGHFELFYQPVVPLQGKDAGLHYEVLLRYHDPRSNEWISPDQFLDAAARYGFLEAIDQWVVQNLCAWLAANPHHLAGLAQVNINLSTCSLLDINFHQLLQDELHRHQLPADKFCIEVTEMVALGELGVSAQWIERLRGQGMKVALDDFGSGFASYAYLRHLPLDILKIDGSFIRNIEHDAINRAMVGSMQQIAMQLGLLTVAESVETQNSMDCLRELGIVYAQGFHIGRPQPLRLLADARQQDYQAG